MLYFNITGLGGSPNPGMDPDTYAQKFAEENGISLEEAKAQLKAKFGDPQKLNSTFAPDVQNNTPSGAIGPVFNYNVSSTIKYNQNDLKNATPEELASFVRYVIQQTGMSEKEIAQEFGLPDKEQPDDNVAQQKLKELGIPEDIIAKGDKAIRKYAEKNNINLPPKERK